MLYLIASIPSLCILTFLDLTTTNGIVSTNLYDKWDDFNFEIVNIPFLNGDVPSSSAYGVCISHFFVLQEYVLMLMTSTKETFF